MSSSSLINLSYDLAEFDFRYNNRFALKISDRERTGKIMEGKRVTCLRISEATNG